MNVYKANEIERERERTKHLSTVWLEQQLWSSSSSSSPLFSTCVATGNKYNNAFCPIQIQAQWSQATYGQTNCIVATVATAAVYKRLYYIFVSVLHSFNFDRVISTRRWPNRLYYWSFLSILILNWIVYTAALIHKHTHHFVSTNRSHVLYTLPHRQTFTFGQFEIDKSFLKWFIFILSRKY